VEGGQGGSGARGISLVALFNGSLVRASGSGRGDSTARLCHRAQATPARFGRVVANSGGVGSGWVTCLFVRANICQDSRHEGSHHSRRHRPKEQGKDGSPHHHHHHGTADIRRNREGEGEGGC